LANTFYERFARIDREDSEALVSNEEILDFLSRNPEVCTVSSHQIRYPMPQAPGFLFYDACFLRDPVDRIRSMYDYFRDKPLKGDPASDLANEFLPGEYIAQLVEHFPARISNLQVNLLANGDTSDDAQTEDDLKRATARMMETSLLGV